MAAAAGAPITPAGSEALRTSRLRRQVDMVHEQSQEACIRIIGELIFQHIRDAIQELGSTLGLLYEFMTKLRVAICDCMSLSSDRVSIMLDIFDVRWSWFRRPIHCVAHMLHPAWRKEDLLEYRGGRGYFSRAIAKDVENQALPGSWWEKFGGLTPMLQSLALQVLSQEVSSSGAERLWSIMGDIYTKGRNRLNTPHLDRLAIVNANLRVLEKAGGLDSAGPVSWLPKQVDHLQIVVEAADISHLQPHTPEDDVYDFIREDMMRFTTDSFDYRSSTWGVHCCYY
ncbi:hypothetical protein GOP47_0027799 [Adiantum capillus-veneris]|nr:hypothetical protein GOP47_0027799 [Adiantum capillus-veneris]